MSYGKLKYFTDTSSSEALKKEYRILCKELHPDFGGSDAAFIEMRKEYGKICCRIEMLKEYAENSHMFIDRLIELAKLRQYKKGWIVHKYEELWYDKSFADYKYLAKRLEYDWAWANLKC